MSIPAAYITVVFIWATTPLALKWSTEEVGFLFGISSRILLGVLIATLLCLVARISVPIHKKALQTYVAGGIGLYFAKFSVYWGAQYIPSGWISIVLGISPILTTMMASSILNERAMTPMKLAAMFISVFGLYVMYNASLEYGTDTIFGIIAVFFSALFFSASIVCIKKINADIRSLSTVTGTLFVTAPLYALTWLFSGNDLPTSIPVRTGFSILYLGVIGSVLGFVLFYYVLKHVEVTRTSLIALITPVCALALGHTLNGEVLTPSAITGSVLILTGLLLFEFKGAIRGSFLWKLTSVRNRHEQE
ncbi:MAG: DMT family transporter [Gammaproteobacteria bacterium]